jgi:hypothetical protein
MFTIPTASKLSCAFSTAALSDGVYLVKIQCSGGKNKVRKIIVSSNKYYFKKRF